MTSCVALPRKKDCNTYQSGSFRWRLAFWKKLRTNNWTSGCGSVGRVVASDTRGLRFESSHRQNFIHVFTINCVEKTKIKKKGPGMAPFLKKPKKQLNQKCSLKFQLSEWNVYVSNSSNLSPLCFHFRTRRCNKKTNLGKGISKLSGVLFYFTSKNKEKRFNVFKRQCSAVNTY